MRPTFDPALFAAAPLVSIADAAPVQLETSRLAGHRISAPGRPAQLLVKRMRRTP